MLPERRKWTKIAFLSIQIISYVSVRQSGLYQAITHRTWGVAYRLTGDYKQSEARLTKALDLFKQLNTRWQAGRVLFELGELSRVRGDPLEARCWFTDALSAFEEMNAQIDLKRTRTALEAM
jgi:tetratricopeptide (TPR) repeat protein